MPFGVVSSLGSPFGLDFGLSLIGGNIPRLILYSSALNATAGRFLLKFVLKYKKYYEYRPHT